jgi:hypothetical protein
MILDAPLAQVCSERPHAAHMVRDHTHLRSLGAGRITRRQVVLDHDLPYLVAELEGYIVGYSYAAPFRACEGYRFTVEDSIYVRADCRGHPGDLEIPQDYQALPGNISHVGRKSQIEDSGVSRETRVELSPHEAASSRPHALSPVRESESNRN